MSGFKGLSIGLWLLVFIVGFTFVIVFVLDTLLDNTVTNFLFKTVLRTPVRVEAEVKVKARLQDSGRNLTTVLMMRKSEMTYGEIIASRTAAEWEGISDAEVVETLEGLGMSMTLFGENGEAVWKHGETLADSPSMDYPLPGLKIGRLSAQ